MDVVSWKDGVFAVHLGFWLLALSFPPFFLIICSTFKSVFRKGENDESPHRRSKRAVRPSVN